MSFPFSAYLDDDQSLLLFRKSGGELVIGQGPFSCSDTPEAGKPAFYLNDFRLKNVKPWLQPSQMVSVEALNLPEPCALSLALNPPSSSAFSQVFDEISQDILAGKIQKSVPVACETGTVQEADKRQLLSNALAHLGAGWLYGFYHPECSFLGHSPELLFSAKHRQLNTMALAGTARRDEIEVFQMDEKEIREHEYVVNYIMSQLSEFGEAVRHPRAVKPLGAIAHFHSPIEVQLNKDQDWNEIMKVMHPTPALGPLPRQAASLNDLMRWRAELNCPTMFGAPFGYYDAQEFTSVVGIRGVHWTSNQLTIPAGCGIIEASRLTSEWRELRLKRQAIKDAFLLRNLEA